MEAAIDGTFHSVAPVAMPGCSGSICAGLSSVYFLMDLRRRAAAFY